MSTSNEAVKWLYEGLIEKCPICDEVYAIEGNGWTDGKYRFCCYNCKTEIVENE